MQVLPMTIINPIKRYFSTNAALASFLSVVSITSNYFHNVEYIVDDSKKKKSEKLQSFKGIFGKDNVIPIPSHIKVDLNNYKSEVLNIAAHYWKVRRAELGDCVNQIPQHQLMSVYRTYLNYLDKSNATTN